MRNGAATLKSETTSGTKPAPGAWSLISASPTTDMGAAATHSKMPCSRIRETLTHPCALLRSARSIVLGSNMLTITTVMISFP